jgi:tRNA threonylcarbamoyladenosine biosynthesis protein TsaB
VPHKPSLRVRSPLSINTPSSTRLEFVLLLAFDTATPAITVAVHDGRRVLASSVTMDAHRHAELLAPAIAQVVADAGVANDDLTAIVTGVGPGPYTGLRVGVVTARVLAATLGIPGHGVCTLDVIATSAAAEGEFLVVTDARRREVYHARYEGARRISGPEVCKPSAVPGRDLLPVFGPGAGLYPDEFPQTVSTDPPGAEVLAGMVAEGTADLLPLEPLYLRRPDAREPGARKRVLQL